MIILFLCYMHNALEFNCDSCKHLDNKVQCKLNLPNRALYIKRHRQEEDTRTEREGYKRRSEPERETERNKVKRRRKKQGRRKVASQTKGGAPILTISFCSIFIFLSHSAGSPEAKPSPLTRDYFAR